MKKNFLILIFIFLTSLWTVAADFTPFYYKGDFGKEYRLQRYYISITGLSKHLEFIDSRDTAVHWEGSYTVQNMYLFENEDDEFMYFQRYTCKVIPTSPNTATYTSQNIWVKIAKDWSIYFDSNGNSYKLYKK